MTRDEEACASVWLDERTTPVRIVLTGSIGAYHSDELFSTCLSALDHGPTAVLSCAEVAHLGGSAAQILLALRAALVARGGGLELRDVPARLAPLLAMAGLLPTGGSS